MLRPGRGGLGQPFVDGCAEAAVWRAYGNQRVQAAVIGISQPAVEAVRVRG
jgi:hypothetical protein